MFQSDSADEQKRLLKFTTDKSLVDQNESQNPSISGSVGQVCEISDEDDEERSNNE